MSSITNITELRAAILLLEIKQANEGKLLKEQFKVTYESLKPVNLIKSTISELVSAPDLKGDLLNASISHAAGYLTKKTIIGETRNPLKELAGSLIQMGVTSLVAKNAEGLKSLAIELISKIINKKKNV
jgi:hypothetical protein